MNTTHPISSASHTLASRLQGPAAAALGVLIGFVLGTMAVSSDSPAMASRLSAMPAAAPVSVGAPPLPAARAGVALPPAPDRLYPAPGLASWMDPAPGLLEVLEPCWATVKETVRC